MKIEGLHDRLRELAPRLEHRERVLRLWSQARPQETGRRRLDTFLPARLIAALPEILVEFLSIARVESEHGSDDGAVRMVMRLKDGQAVETVLLPRGGVCVSTQVGCAVGCVFCQTGRSGLLRQLGSAEIVAQVAMARARRAVRKVVFMGMGEPAHNLDHVLEAINFLGTFGDVARQNLVFSTVGDRRVFEELPRSRVQPALALSLHTTKAVLRGELLPRAARIDPAELVALADDYGVRIGYPVQVQWTLIAGVNDGDDELDGIVRLLGGRRMVLNLIPYNTVDGLPFQRPDWARAAGIARRLHRRGVLTKLRQSAAQDVDGACGQLRARAVVSDVRPLRYASSDAGSAGLEPAQQAVAVGIE